MCLIIKSDNASELKQNLLTSAYHNNSDGFGGMFLADGKIQTFKHLPKTEGDVVSLWDRYKDMNIPMGLHFRFTTNGGTNRSNCHPFEVLNMKQHNRSIWVMHNGPQLPTPMIDVDKSDTHQYVKWILRPMLAHNPELLYNSDWRDMIEESIGSDKLLFLDGSNGKFTIINEDHGETMDSMWLSNTYSIQRGMGSDYDVKTDTISTQPKAITSYNKSWFNGYNATDYSYADDIYNYDKWTSKANAKKSVDLCDDNTPYNLADLVGLSQADISEVIYHNPMGTAEMLGDLVTADEMDMYDAIDHLIDARSNKKGGTKND
tara:strand:+ start:2090 stop:3043 length:954 start_codon:yes stop_codon:yes gene_type:complete